MRYENVDQFPDTLREVLPDPAQEIYLQAYQKAWDRYREEQGGDLGRDAVAHRDGMHAVRDEYVKVEGKWHHRSEAPEVEEEEGELI